MKLIIGIAIVCFCGYCGVFFSKKYRKRKAFFGQFSSFNERFINEVSYYRRPLSDFANGFSYKGEFGALLFAYFDDLKQNSTKNSAMDRCFSAYDFLSSEEKKFTADYFQMLGAGDSHSQKSYFSGATSTLTEWKNKTSSDAEKYGGLYLKLGVLLGLTILIVLI